MAGENASVVEWVRERLAESQASSAPPPTPRLAIMATTFRAAQALAQRAAEKELAQDLDGAYELHVAAAQAFLHLSGTGADAGARSRCKAEAARAVERAEKIKRARADVRPVARDMYSASEQQALLRASARVNGLIYPAWEEGGSNAFPEGGAHFEDSEYRRSSLASPGPVHSWQPATTVLPNARMHSADLLPLDILQSVVTNCSVVASLAVCLAHHRRFGSKIGLSSLFPQDNDGLPRLNSRGKYAARMHVNGGWRRVPVLDDSLPCDANGTLICATTGRKANLWPSLLEKAYMKLMGGYDFDGSDSARDLSALVNWIPEHVSFNAADFNKQRTLSHLQEGIADGTCLVTLGTGKSPTRLRWLIDAHNYAVIDITPDGVFHVLNPWRMNHETEKNVAVQHLPWDDICLYFDSLYINWDPRLFSGQKTVHGLWKGRETSKAASEAASSTVNNHIRLRITSKATEDDVLILLSRHITKKNDPDVFIAVHSLRRTEDEKSFNPRDAIGLRGVYTNSTHTLTRVRPGVGVHEFYVIASRQSDSRDIAYSLTVFATCDIVLEPSPLRAMHSKQIDGAFTTKTAGGSWAHPTFMNNPQWLLRVGAVGAAARAKVAVRVTVEGPKDLPLNIRAVWSSGARVTDLLEGDTVLDSGMYNRGIAYAEKELQVGTYAIVVSAFAPKDRGRFSMLVECALPFTLEPIPQEDAGMYGTAVPGVWAYSSSGGAPSFGQFHKNPQLVLHVPAATQIIARLQLTSWSPNIPINLTLFSRKADSSLGRELATSGPYAEPVSGVRLHVQSLTTGGYALVPSTYSPGTAAEFRVLLYHSAPGVELTAPAQ